MERLEQSFEQERIRHPGFVMAEQFEARGTVETEARRLIQERRQLPEVPVAAQERRDNARTALMEALTASGHLSRIELTGTLAEINAQVLSRLLNGWDDNLPVHEKNRRFAELCNELYIQKVHEQIVAGGLPPGTALLEFSDYPTALAGHRLGYRDSNKKGMVRSTHLEYQDNNRYKRVIEQVSRSNGTGPSTFSFLETAGIVKRPGPDDIAALETPVIYSRYDYVDGVVDVMRFLDQHSGAGVRYGDQGSDKHPEYEELRMESARREQEIECYTLSLAKLETQLDQLLGDEQISRIERNAIFAEEIDRILSAICTLNPDYAEDTFGEQAAPHFYRASLLEAQGQTQQAWELIASVQHLKDFIIFCGMTISLEKAKEMGIEVNSFGELVEMGKDSWKWKKGVCQVKSCPTRPGKTEVGPCSVCRHCQDEFDKGNDPTKTAQPAEKPRKPKPIKLTQAA